MIESVRLEDEVTKERGDRQRGVAGLGRKVARGPQTLQASRRLSLLRFIGIQRARPCTSPQPLSLYLCLDAPTISQ